MRKLATVFLLVSLLLILTSCGGTKHSAKLPPKPCRMTSTKAACQAYLEQGTKSNNRSTGGIDVIVMPASCPDRQYPALCKKP